MGDKASNIWVHKNYIDANKLLYFLPLNAVMDATLSTNSPDDEQLSDTVFSFSKMKSFTQENVLADDEVGGGLGTTSIDKPINYVGFFMGGFVVILDGGLMAMFYVKRRRGLEN